MKYRTIKVELNDEEFSALTELAFKEGRSMPRQFRRMVLEYMKEAKLLEDARERGRRDYLASLQPKMHLIKFGGEA
jgi:hypothetical protein